MNDRKPDARGEDTRRRLLQAGLELFGEFGFERVTTRELARRASVNLAAIPYHFGTKEALYLAVAEEIVTHIRSRMSDRLKALRAQLDEDTSRRGLIDATTMLLAGLCREVLADRDAPARAMFIFREQARPTRAFDVLYHGFMERLHTTLSQIIGRLSDRPADDEDVILQTHAMLGQIIGFRAAQSVALRRLGWEGYGEAEADRIAEVVTRQTRRALLAQIGEGQLGEGDA